MTTVTIWPNATGEGYGLTPSTGNGWDCLNDTSETDYVYITNSNELYQYSYYNMENISLPSNAIITNLRLSALTSYNGTSGSGYCKLAVKTNNNYFSSGWASVSYYWPYLYTKYYDWSVNPSTNKPWTQSEINNLFAGMYLRCDEGTQTPERRVKAYWLSCQITYVLAYTAHSQIIGLSTW